MYLIPKNIKTKKEIFKGFGILEILAVGLSCLVGFVLQSIVSEFKLKVFLFSIFPLTTFLLIFPLPNGSTALMIFKKFVIFKKRQKIYKYK